MVGVARARGGPGTTCAMPVSHSIDENITMVTVVTITLHHGYIQESWWWSVTEEQYKHQLVLLISAPRKAPRNSPKTGILAGLKNIWVTQKYLVARWQAAGVLIWSMVAKTIVIYNTHWWYIGHQDTWHLIVVSETVTLWLSVGKPDSDDQRLRGSKR